MREREREKLIDIHSEKGDLNTDFADSTIRGFDGLSASGLQS